MYELLVSGIALLPRLPAFGDYGIEGAAGTAAPPPMVTWNRMSASIRYTGLGGWFIVRGDMMNVGGNQQFHKLAADIEHSAHWKGRSYSWGDGYLYKCAHHTAKAGTHKQWRAVGVNHHITQVVEEVSTLLGP